MPFGLDIAALKQSVDVTKQSNDCSTPVPRSSVA